MFVFASNLWKVIVINLVSSACFLHAQFTPRGQCEIGAEQMLRTGMRVFGHHYVFVIEHDMVEPAMDQPILYLK